MYWSIQGLADPLQMMPCAAKVDQTVILYDLVKNDKAGWTGVYFSEKPAIGSKCSCALVNLPFVIDQTQERIICQTNACFTHMGWQLGVME